MNEHTPLTTSSFQGLYSRSDDTKVPYDHLLDCLNLRFKDGEFETREGSELDITFSGIKRHRIYQKQGQTPIHLILDSNGNLYNSTSGTPILTVVGMTDFAMVVINERAYISPHNGLTAIAGSFVYVYEGSGVARKAAGIAPVTAPTLTDSATGGSVEAGMRLVAIAFETESGYITRYGPATLITNGGGVKLDVSNIQVGGADVIARHVVSTQTLLIYNGNPDEQEFFFVPDGNISNNIDDEVTVDFFDADLVNSCDYLLEQLVEIPAGIALVPYNGRLCVIAPNDNPDMVWVSKKLEPESFNEVEGFLRKVDSQVYFKNGYEFRGLLYLAKSNRTYNTRDTGDEAIYWEVLDVDMAVGAECHTVAVVLDNEGKNIYDSVFQADRSGLFQFNGSFADKPMSWKIDKIWGRINKNNFHKVDIVIDPERSCGYVAIPLDEATTNSHLLYFDFSRSLSAEDIRWCPWLFPISPVSISVEINSSTKKTVLKYAGENVYKMDDTLHNDGVTAISNYARGAYVSSGEVGSINHFSGLRTNVVGSGSLRIDLYTLRDVRSINPTAITLNTTSEYSRTRGFGLGLMTEKASLKLSLNASNAWMRVTEVTLFCKPVYATRPNE